MNSRVKIKENEKRDKYLDLARELKKLGNMIEMMMLIVVDTLGTVPEGLEKRLVELKNRGRIKNIQTIALLKSARILSKVLNT